MADVVLNEVTKTFPGGTTAVNHVSLAVEDGEFVVLVGPSGCGKSTVLRIIAGLEDATSGTVSIGGRVVNDLPPKERDIAMVFQNYALYPHMTVDENLSFSLRIAHRAKENIRAQVGETARVLGLEELLHRKPAALSGGQRQRVAMGRAIVRQPQVFLMDEPLSNLDAKLRVAMRGELTRLHQRYGTTTLYVTHDQTEAMTLGDRIAVLDSGRLQQVGPPEELYAAPCNIFVAGFIGSPAMNLARVRVDADNGLVLVVGDHRWPVPAAVLTARPAVRGYAGREIVLGLRPTAFGLPAGPDANGALLTVDAVTVESLGTEKNVILAPPIVGEARIDVTHRTETVGDVGVGEMWTARLPATARVRTGERVTLSVDLAGAYFFDPDTTAALPVAEAVLAAA
ncbi:sn-glycerol-3-phosphate ABC transporter ATP-binding protein UgpC [Micromonospora purpureochromogenes]|uniref:ABC transporter ATP-binding protein n=1 Tax=Micromonospora purpureochromogenes TaxID=47872 RepID=UPI003322F1E6